MSDDDLKFNRRFLAGFAVMLTVAALAYLGAITFLPLPAANVRFADTILGFMLGTLLGTVIAFFFGSSKSSQNKAQRADAVVQALTADPPAELTP